MQEYVLEHSRLRIPALLSTECPHGHQALDSYLLPVTLNMGATFNTELIHSAYSVCGKQLREMGLDSYLLPVTLNMGATFNTELIHSAYSVCGKQLREMGVDLALISLLDVVRDPRWGRIDSFCF